MADLGRLTYRTISRTFPYPASRIVDRNVSLNLIILIITFYSVVLTITLVKVHLTTSGSVKEFHFRWLKYNIIEIEMSQITAISIELRSTI